MQALGGAGYQRKCRFNGRVGIFNAILDHRKIQISRIATVLKVAESKCRSALEHEAVAVA